MAGGTFREKAPTAPTINTLSTGGFLVLSALLAETTGDNTYLEAAKESADFISNHLLNAQHVVQDGISVRENDSCALDSEVHQDSYNSGLMIEGLAILYSITMNASIFDTIEEMVTAAIQYSGWQGINGIIGNGESKSGDMMLPRALSAVTVRNATTPALQSYIQAYLSVQFNAVVDLATKTGSNVYSGSWNGPPSLKFSPANQTNAIQVLISAVNLDNHTAPTNSPSPNSTNPPSSASSPSFSPSSSSFSPSSSPSPTPHKASKIGPIVGSTLGGVSILLGLVVGVIMWRHRVQATTPGSSMHPFDLQSSSSPVMSSSYLSNPQLGMAQPRAAKLNTSADQHQPSSQGPTIQTDSELAEAPPDYRASVVV